MNLVHPYVLRRVGCKRESFKYPEITRHYGLVRFHIWLVYDSCESGAMDNSKHFWVKLAHFV